MLDQATPLRLGALGVGLFLAVILGTFGIMAMHRSAYERCQATPPDDPIAMDAGSAEAQWTWPWGYSCVYRDADGDIIAE